MKRLTLKKLSDVAMSCLAVVWLMTMEGCGNGSKKDALPTITLSSLMNEMVDIESDPSFPYPYYSAKQMTSYDRRSIIANTKEWHANDDWGGFIRYEVNNGRVEKVLFDEQGPGVLTRIITTGGDRDANLRFYFDSEQEASIVIPSFDISKFPVKIPAGMIYMHEHYPTTQGCSFYYPIPYDKSCKITVDNTFRNYVYHVNYRTYELGTVVQTFSIEKANSLAAKAEEVGRKLQNPENYTTGEIFESGDLGAGSSLLLKLPDGSKAVRTMNFKISNYQHADYEQLMRGLIVSICFDGVETVRAPLSDFSGGGMGAPEVKNWYMTADGKGGVTIRFIMPYKENATVEIKNITSYNASAQVKAVVSQWKWKPNTLYFHASWRQENGLETNQGIDYNMGTITGRGVLKADVLTLYNYSPRWYGEGDEHIWVDQDEFPSHFGCGTEDYYNTTYAPISVFHNPFGGSPREDDQASRGYNNWVRTRNLDAIPFGNRLKFDFELISWDGGKVDYSSTLFWYGDIDSKAISASADNDALYALPPAIYTGDAN